MSLVNDVRSELARAVDTLHRRAGNTADAAEIAAIRTATDALNGRIADLDRASLLDAATLLAAAEDDLEGAVAAARHGPFDGYLATLEEHFRSLGALSGRIHGRDGLAPAPAPAGEGAAPPPRSSRARRGADAGLGAPQASKDFPTLRDEYQAWFDACAVRPEQKGNVAYYLNRLNKGRSAYEAVGRDLNGIPWVFVGVIHGMECGFNFAGHLHNGDPLTARTVHVPAGRPLTGAPPFTWGRSAEDALTMKGYHQVTDWSVPHMLYLLEKYNGFGYRMRSLPTPYLWSFSNLYEKGKFVADGHFDPEAVSRQCGAALMLKAALAAGEAPG